MDSMNIGTQRYSLHYCVLHVDMQCYEFVWNFFHWRKKSRQRNWQYCVNNVSFSKLNVLFIELLYKSDITHKHAGGLTLNINTVVIQIGF